LLHHREDLRVLPLQQAHHVAVAALEHLMLARKLAVVTSQLVDESMEPSNLSPEVLLVLAILFAAVEVSPGDNLQHLDTPIDWLVLAEDVMDAAAWIAAR